MSSSYEMGDYNQPSDQNRGMDGRDRGGAGSELAGMPPESGVDGAIARSPMDPMSAFIPDMMGWCCRHCNMVPYAFREPKAVWVSREPPSPDFVEQHLVVCRGNFPNQSSHMSSLPPPNYPGHNQDEDPGNYEPQHNPYDYHPGPYHEQQPMPPHIMQQYMQAPPPPYGYPSMQMQMQGYPMQPYGSYTSYDPHPHVGEEVGPIGIHDGANDEYIPEEDEYQTSVEATKKKKRKNKSSSRIPQPLPTSLPPDYKPSVTGNEIFASLGENSLLRQEDRTLVTDYFAFLMQQLIPCYFSELDRASRGGKRDYIEVGFAGIQCKHCEGHPTSRKFFWSDPGRFSNSFSEIPAHVMKCALCPSDVKNKLVELKILHREQMAKMPRGSQKLYLKRMWNRIHGLPDNAEAPVRSKESKSPRKRKKQEDTTSGANSDEMKLDSSMRPRFSPFETDEAAGTGTNSKQVDGQPVKI